MAGQFDAHSCSGAPPGAYGRSARELPELCRIAIVQDGRAKATFSDNTILLTNSAGSTFVAVSPDGHCTRQLSEYALARHSPLLAALLEFRNMHVEHPCVCRPLAQALRSSFTLGYVIRDATWPVPEAAAASGLAALQPDGKVAVSSEDGVARVVLHGHQRRFAVCYPLLVGERPQQAQYEYVWQTQVFSVLSYPARWEPAVQAALAAAAQLAPQQQLQQHSDTHDDSTRSEAGSDSSTGTTVSMRYGVGSDAPDLRRATPGAHPPLALTLTPASARLTELPRADGCVHAGLTQPLQSDGWWAEPSLSLLPPSEVLALEWTPHATYHYLAPLGELEAWVHADESCLVTSQGGRFLAHFRDPGPGAPGPGRAAVVEGAGTERGAGACGPAAEQLYAAHCVPEMVWSRDQSCRYRLAALAAHALKLRSHNAAVITAAAAAAAEKELAGAAPARPRALPGLDGARGGPPTASATDALFAALSTVVLEDSEVAGQGRYTAYEDGRVRVCFEDRTILHMSADHAYAKVVLPDGRPPRVVAVANPVGVERYVDAALDFARWAFKTPAERSEELRAQARVRAEVLASQRMVQLVAHAATGALPPGAVGLCGGAGRGGGAGGTMGGGQGGSGAVDEWHRGGGGGGGVGGVGEREEGRQEVPPPWMGQGGGGMAGDLDRQAMIEQLLSRNAQLLERL